MEKGKHSINIDNRTVTFGHVTKTMDGEIALTTTFDMSKLSMERMMKRAADAELIAWRAKSGIKGLTTIEAQKLDNIIVDCSIIAVREKHVETPEEKESKAFVKQLIDKHGTEGLKELLERAMKLKELDAEIAAAN
jgi:hypothetical protein